MFRIMFVCHGNICRSPMAEFIFKNMIRKEGISDRFFVSSSAVSSEELGNPVYPPAKRELARHGISCDGKRAVRFEQGDYARYDLIAVMDQSNIRNLLRIIGEDRDAKIRLLMSFTGTDTQVSDPWYSGDFAAAYRDIETGCAALLAYLKTRAL